MISKSGDEDSLGLFGFLEHLNLDPKKSLHPGKKSHGTWEYTSWRGKSFSKPSFSDSMLILRGVRFPSSTEPNDEFQTPTVSHEPVDDRRFNLSFPDWQQATLPRCLKMDQTPQWWRFLVKRNKFATWFKMTSLVEFRFTQIDSPQVWSFL